MRRTGQPLPRKRQLRRPWKSGQRSSQRTLDWRTSGADCEASWPGPVFTSCRRLFGGKKDERWWWRLSGIESGNLVDDEQQKTRARKEQKEILADFWKLGTAVGRRFGGRGSSTRQQQPRHPHHYIITSGIYTYTKEKCKKMTSPIKVLLLKIYNLTSNAVKVSFSLQKFEVNLIRRNHFFVSSQIKKIPEF